MLSSVKRKSVVTIHQVRKKLRHFTIQRLITSKDATKSFHYCSWYII